MHVAATACLVSHRLWKPCYRQAVPADDTCHNLPCKQQLVGGLQGGDYVWQKQQWQQQARHSTNRRAHCVWPLDRLHLIPEQHMATKLGPTAFGAVRSSTACRQIAGTEAKEGTPYVLTLHKGLSLAAECHNTAL